MKQLAIVPALLLLLLVPAFAADPLIPAIEDLYVVVLADSIQNTTDTNRVNAVALGVEPGMLAAIQHNYIPLPVAMWSNLASRLASKGVDPTTIVPLNEIGRYEGKGPFRLMHKPSGKQAWVYSISGIEWHGEHQLYVQQEAYNGSLSAAGCTVIVERQNGTWVIIRRIADWVS